VKSIECEYVYKVEMCEFVTKCKLNSHFGCGINIGGAVGWGTALAGKSRVRFPMGVTAIFHLHSFRSHYGPGVDSASNRSEYQEYLLDGERGRCVGLTILLPSCLEILDASASWSHRACPGQ